MAHLSELLIISVITKFMFTIFPQTLQVFQHSHLIYVFLSWVNFLDFTLSHCTPGTSKTNTPSCNVTLHFYFGSNASATLVFHIYHSSPHFVFITHQGGFLGWELLFFFYLWQNATKETRFSLPTIELATFFQVSTSVVADHPLIACPSSH